ncbi:SGNH/GDSL hydrolase family protein [Pontibacter locisalis]|uniref:SGNH/GDSL hydrolase family protein n=1 Tax=Pontibacter locisalis TaxID=1719035 RepID=A0ABW5IKZ0_9BACT
MEKQIIRKHKSQILAYEEQNSEIKECDFLLIGDSHTYGIPEFELHHTSTVANRALNGETTKGVLFRLEKNILSLNPTYTVIQLGYNDLKYRSVENTITNYKKILSELKSERTYIVSLFPVFHERTFINSKIITFNKALRDICAGSENYIYIDIHRKLYDYSLKGINPTYTSDGTHLTASGYSIYVEGLKNHILKN